MNEDTKKAIRQIRIEIINNRYEVISVGKGIYVTRVKVGNSQYQSTVRIGLLKRILKFFIGGITTKDVAKKVLEETNKLLKK